MEMLTSEAATQLGVSQRQVQRLARGGRVVSRNFAGRTVVARGSVLAASRTMKRGRRWDAQTVAAATELLEQGTTERIAGSQRSRLRARLRTITIGELAYHALGDRVSIWRRAGKASVRSKAVPDGFTSTGEKLNIKVTQSARALARKLRLLQDNDGDILIVEIDTDAPAVIEDIALFAYGDTRTSSAARQRLETRLTAVA